MIRTRLTILAALVMALALSSCTNSPTGGARLMKEDSATPSDAAAETATFGAGCYWCIEAALQQLDGVHAVISGFTGGHVDDPSYAAVCTGTTGHNEVVKVTFDPAKISYDTLLDWFFKLHDPTTLNRQGNDIGPQYRSGIYFHSPEQETAARAALARWDESGTWSDPIVTEIMPASTFWPAGADQQDYYRRNPKQGYCQYIIAPKLKKLGFDY